MTDKQRIEMAKALREEAYRLWYFKGPWSDTDQLRRQFVARQLRRVAYRLDKLADRGANQCAWYSLNNIGRSTKMQRSHELLWKVIKLTRKGG